MGREIENIRTCDVVVIAGGRSGTLGEFSIAYDEAKVIDVLANSGGIVDHIEEITRLVDKDTGSVVISDPDPIKLLNLLEKHMKSECFRVTWG
jgi:glutamine amidotransferase PdxT